MPKRCTDCGKQRYPGGKGTKCRTHLLKDPAILATMESLKNANQEFAQMTLQEVKSDRPKMYDAFLTEAGVQHGYTDRKTLNKHHENQAKSFANRMQDPESYANIRSTNNAAKKRNPESQRRAQRRYDKTEKGRESSKRRAKRYRAKQRRARRAREREAFELASAIEEEGGHDQSRSLKETKTLGKKLINTHLRGVRFVEGSDDPIFEEGVRVDLHYSGITGADHEIEGYNQVSHGNVVRSRDRRDEDVGRKGFTPLQLKNLGMEVICAHREEKTPVGKKNIQRLKYVVHMLLDRLIIGLERLNVLSGNGGTNLSDEADCYTFFFTVDKSGGLYNAITDPKGQGQLRFSQTAASMNEANPRYEEFKDIVERSMVDYDKEGEHVKVDGKEVDFKFTQDDDLDTDDEESDDESEDSDSEDSLVAEVSGMKL